MRWLLVSLLGAGLGVAAGVGDALVRRDHSQAAAALHLATGCASVWAGAAILGGVVMARAPWSVLAGPAVVVMGVLGYYAAGTVQRGRVDLTLAHLHPLAKYWLVAAVFLGPALGLVGGMTHAANLTGLLARLVAPVAVVTEILVRYPLSRAEFQIEPATAWTSLALVVLGCLGALFAVVGQTAASQ